MGWISDLLFGKTVEIEYRNKDGSLVKNKVPKEKFDALMDKAIAEKKAEVLKVCDAHIIDPIKGKYTERFIIGKEIPEDVYERFKDEKGELYALVHYEAGKPNTSLLDKNMWLQAARAFGDIDQEADAFTKDMMKKIGQ